MCCAANAPEYRQWDGHGDVAAQVAGPSCRRWHQYPCAPDHSGNYQFEEAAIGAIEWECAQARLRAMPTPTATELRAVAAGPHAAETRATC